MATLAQLNPEAKVYPILKQVDWRATHISTTEGAAQSAAYGADAAMDDVDRRQHLHRALDAICSQQNFTQDKAARMHNALDRLLDEQPGIFGEFESEFEEPEEELDEEPEEEAEATRVRKQHVGDSMSVAMDGGKCEQCRISDGKPAPTGKAASVQSIIDFWERHGIHLREA